MKKPACVFCTAFCPDPVRDRGGICRRYAPDGSGWATVRNDDWCLEFTPREESAPSSAVVEP